ncbi:MAG: acetyl-CoA hydrolase/transferase C-terminal domain-containing protein [Thermodesulfobacteriota bacterium]
MKNDRPIYFTDPDKLVDFVIDKVGKNITLGMCLGLGKPNHFANAIYKRAKEDPNLRLRILTALSLEPPTWSSDLERRFLEPLVQRVWKGYVNLDYITAVRKKELPPNVEVSEFFYKAGGYLDNEHMQQNYTSTNYTHAARDVRDNGMNVGGQLVAKKMLNGKPMFSMSSNSDTALDAFREIERQRKEGRRVAAIGQVNNNLPFMYGDAVISPDCFDAVLEAPELHFSLFGAPREPVTAIDYVIGMHASSLIKDGGTLQIGIGSLGDAIAYGLQMRHLQNDIYNNVLQDLNVFEKFSDIITRVGGSGVFDKGIYGSTEMLVDAFLHLYKAGIMKRKVYDNIPLQKLLNEGKIQVKQKVTPQIIEMLAEQGAIHPKLTQKDFNFLQEYGILKAELTYENGEIVNGKDRFAADLRDANSKDRLFQSCLGKQMKDGFWMHAGFFLGPPDFYDMLNNMSEEERMQINMTSVLNTNQLYGNNPYSCEELKLLQRKDARFINAGLMVMLSGAVVSDGLEDLRVISGVGGQYNFVAQAHAIEDARGVLMIRSTRAKGKEVSSNVVFNYGHTTVPRHLRDIIVTEYGIADLRGRSDKNVICALLNVTDSRFQEGLLQRAKQAKKIPADYQIPDRFRNNYPERLEKALASYKEKKLFPVFPFGTAFTDEEIVIGKSLREFKEKAAESKMAVLPGLVGQLVSAVPESARKYLERMQLDKPTNRQERMMQKIVVLALKQAGQI